MLDAGIPDEWPPEVIEAVARFRLGHVIEEPPLVYARDPRNRVWTPDGEGEGEGTEKVVSVSAEQFPYGIITTQTCDLAEQTRYPRQPFVQLSPVYRYSSDPAVAADVRKRQYLVELSGPRFADGIWVADLRLEGSAEKSVLVGREPLEAFRDEAEEIAFADTLGRRRDRAALANVVNDVLSRELGTKQSRNRNKAKRVWESVYSTRLEVAEGVRLDPRAVRLHVVLHGDPASGDEAIVEAKDWFEKWWDRTSPAAEASEPSLRLLANAYNDARAVHLPLFDRLIPFGRAP